MTLAFSASRLIWEKYPHTFDSYVSDKAQIDALKSFLNALYRSHGSDETAAAEQIDDWIKSENHSFFSMLSPLLARLNTRMSLASVDLVVLAHWTHDTLIGHSVTNAVLHEIQADAAFGIALSDHGITSSWLALSLMEDYLDDVGPDGTERTALLLITDQCTSLHNSPCLKRRGAQPCAGVILLKKTASGPVQYGEEEIIFRRYTKVKRSAREDYSRLLSCSEHLFNEEERDLPLIIMTSSALISRLGESESLPDGRLLCWDDSLLSVAPWALLKQHAQPASRYLFIEEENDAFIVAALVSGGRPCI